MRKTLLLSILGTGVMLGSAAFAQAPAPNTAAMPQPGTSQAATPQATMPSTGMSSVRPMRQPRYAGTAAQRGMARRAVPRATRAGMEPMAAPATADGARPGNVPGTGQSLPLSDQASNINGGTTRSDIAPRLPNPDASGNSPNAFLTAADRALARNQTGAAQEALERAETRLLDRSTDPAMASDPSRNPRVMQIGQARQALARRDMAGARAAIRAAMAGG